MNKKDTQYKAPSFEKFLGAAMVDLFHPSSKNCLYDSKHLNLINFNELKLVNTKELNIVKWSDLNLVDLKMLAVGFQYIGAVSFLALFLSSLALSVIIDEHVYRASLNFTRVERTLALEKAISSPREYAGQENLFVVNSDFYETSNVLGVTDSELPVVEEVVVEEKLSDQEAFYPYIVDEIEEVEAVEAEITLEEEDNTQTFFRDGLCSFSASGVLYASGSVLNPTKNLKVCVKSTGDESLQASVIRDNGAESKDLNLTNNCFTASQAGNSSVISVSLVGADQARIGGCSLLVSTL